VSRRRLYGTAPFPYFGGKSQVAPLVWARLGDVKNYIEPFAGSLAVLLKRPGWDWRRGVWADGQPRIETVNDVDGLLTNTWRAIQLQPAEVARHASWIVSECDLTARHIWLVNRREELTARLMGDPEWCDPKAAGWWLWGIACWIGGGWCSGQGGWSTDGERLIRLRRAGPGVTRRIVRLSGAQGIHKQTVHQMDDTEFSGQCDISLANITAWMMALSHRLRRVSICCGDWSRVCGHSPTIHRATPVGIFFDPPYSDAADRTPELYARDSLAVAHAVREWCIAHGDDPRYRIVLAGYEGEHDMPDSWECVHGKAGSGRGYNATSTDPQHIHKNAGRERLWFSPHCLKPMAVEQRLF